jgi:hypothetical protein
MTERCHLFLSPRAVVYMVFLRLIVWNTGV